MRLKKIMVLLPYFLILGPAAQGQVMDALLPDDVYGYTTPFAVTLPHKAARAPETGWGWGGLSLAPSLEADAGYDSAPNGAAPGSAALNLTPALALSDPAAGFGAYVSADIARYPGHGAQDSDGVTAAGGERILLPRETITVSALYLRARETGFTLGSPVMNPTWFNVRDARASDAITDGMLTLTPQVSFTWYDVPAVPAQDRGDARVALAADFAPGGPLAYALDLHVTQSSYKDTVQNAVTYAALAGLTDTVDGLWTLSLLTGGAWRVPRVGRGLAAPVLEGRLDWVPEGLDRVRLQLAREIDDPDQLSATPYTLSQAKLDLTHEWSREVTLQGAAEISHADYMHSPLREDLFSASARAAWQAAPALALDTEYRFNSRQANMFGAANEHVVTAGVVWTP